MTKKRIPISKLAEYAADPDGYVSRKGSVMSPSAALHGTKHHDALGKPPSSRVPVLISALLGLILFLFFVFYVK